MKAKNDKVRRLCDSRENSRNFLIGVVLFGVVISIPVAFFSLSIGWSFVVPLFGVPVVSLLVGLLLDSVLPAPSIKMEQEKPTGKTRKTRLSAGQLRVVACVCPILFALIFGSITLIPQLCGEPWEVISWSSVMFYSACGLVLGLLISLLLMVVSVA